MMRTAVYARFSSELQHDRSIEDQIALCRGYADRNGLSIVAAFHDRARSGASILGRDGLVNLLDSARDGKFDVILVEALDRGLLGSLYLTDLAHKVRRGMQGVVRDGCHAGGRAYGYKPAPGKSGELEIVPGEADVIRRIFVEYVNGSPPRVIAFGLNRDGNPPRRGSGWSASTINGNKSRHHGIVLNELCAGQIVWNRVRMVKDPDTGKRVSRPNPVEEWKRTEAPYLAIVGSELFSAAQARKKERSIDSPQKQRKAKFLLSGLLKCGCCGGGMSMKDRDHGRVRVHCTTMRESGSCSNRGIFYMDENEGAVLSGLQQHLKAPHLLKEFARSYEEERKRLAGEKHRRRAQLERKLGQIQRATDRLWADYEAERVSMDIAGPKLREFHSQKVAIEAEMAEAPEDEKIVGLHPAALREYGRHVEQLQSVFSDGVTQDLAEAAGKIRNLVARVTLIPEESGFKIELEGRMALLMQARSFIRTCGSQRRG